MSRPHLAACPACARHVRVSECTCPFCRSTLTEAFGATPARQAPRERLTRAALYAFGTAALAVTPACSSSGSQSPGSTGMSLPLYGGFTPGTVEDSGGARTGDASSFDATSDAEAGTAVSVTDANASDVESGSPNVTPGRCVLSDGVWYCGEPYGNIPACPQDTEQGSCAFDAGTCFVCYESAGETYDCVDGGWVVGLPTETGCTEPQGVP
jgi:hypothetical protein